ncbi:MAG TPA: hypothetical protein VFH51_05045, partial [Myxococcota bacterium]|nr:hypothetical protein [Myxococcota bacterium]
MMRKLTLLTAYFPYPPGEEFIATEMEYLARAYDVIDVVPTARFASPPAAPPPRTLPRNVRVRHDILRRLHATKGRAGVRRGMALLADADGRALLRAALLPAATFWRDPSHGVAARWLSRRARSLLAFIGHALAVRDALQAGGAEPPYY